MTLPVVTVILLAAALWWWLSSRSLVGALARNAQSESALQGAARRVQERLRVEHGLAVEVIPVWAHGCPCLRVTAAATGQPLAPEVLAAARATAERLLEAAVRDDPVFGAARSRYRGQLGLHWWLGAPPA